MAIIYGYSSRNFSIYRTGDVKLVTKMRGVRSPNYDPSRHGTGWTSKMPDRRALTLLDNPNVQQDTKIEYIESNGATPPADWIGTVTTTDSLIASPEGEGPVEFPDGTIRYEEEPEILVGRITTHYLINYCSTGFGYNLRRRLEETSEIERVRQEYQGS